MWINGTITNEDDFADIINKANKKFAELDKQSGRIRNALAGLKPALAKSLMTGATKWKSMTIKERQTLLRDTVESILLYKDRLQITTKLNPTRPTTINLKRGYGNRLEIDLEWWKKKALKLKVTVDFEKAIDNQY